MLKILKRQNCWIAAAVCLSLAHLPAHGQGTPGGEAQAAEQLLTDTQFVQLCSAETVFGYFQRMCLGKSSNAQAVTDAWVVFRSRNRDALGALRQVCQKSRRWPALAARMAQDEQKANIEWQQKPPEQVAAFCGKLPAALTSAELEAALRKFSDQVKIAPPAAN